MTNNRLTPEEERVIVHKGTERPFSGEYWNHFAPGTYVCRRCNATLYRATDKFKSECGWPSFDNEVPGAVKRVPDADGRRTEIVCAACGAHLGHVFIGEQMTPKNTRHCVNSVSIRFVPAPQAKTERAIFAGGCFWGVQYQLAHVPGVVSAAAGYTGGRTEKPTYEDVCSHTTGHAEAVEVVFDPAKVSFEDLTKVFFEIHDPTQLNRQGPDRGDQYRSAIFYTDEAQKATAEKLIEQLRAKKLNVVTQRVPATTFWKAEAYHQDYFEKNGAGAAACHRRVKRF